LEKRKPVSKLHVTRTSWKPGQSGNPAGRPRRVRPAVPDPTVAAVQREDPCVGGGRTIVPSPSKRTWLNRLTRRVVQSAAMPRGPGWLEVGPDGQPVDDLGAITPGFRGSIAWREGGATPEPAREGAAYKYDPQRGRAEG
jgi:hypothetical protein